MNQKPAAVSNNTNEEEKRVIPLVEESVDIPTSEHIESMDEIRGITDTKEGDANQRVEIESRAARDIESQTRTDNNNTTDNINILADTEANVVPTSTTNQGLPEVEAYLVEDIEEEEVEVYMATPTLPWWKQKRTKILLGVVIVLVGD
jgi:hypothetical protein